MVEFTIEDGGIKDGRASSGSGVANEEPVFNSQFSWSQSPRGGIVVHRSPRIVKAALHRGPESEGIFNCSDGGGAFGKGQKEDRSGQSNFSCFMGRGVGGGMAPFKEIKVAPKIFNF